VVQPILDVWTALPPRDFPNYPAGSWGPEAAAELLHRDGREWRDPLHKRGAIYDKKPESAAAPRGATANR
jgi:hypothetical protein